MVKNNKRVSIRRSEVAVSRYGSIDLVVNLLSNIEYVSHVGGCSSKANEMHRCETKV
jgi:hypothetical protein